MQVAVFYPLKREGAEFRLWKGRQTLMFQGRNLTFKQFQVKQVLEGEQLLLDASPYLPDMCTCRS